MIFRNPQLLYLLALLPAIWLVWYIGRRRTPLAALGLRLGIVALLILAIAEPLLGQTKPEAGPLVLLIDQSDSLSAAGKAELWARARKLAAESAAPVRAIAFGATTRAVPSALLTSTAEPTAEECPLGAERCPAPDGTDIAGALRQARELIGTGGGRVVLLSDGQATTGDALAEAALARAAGITVDAVPFAPPGVPEAALTGLVAPPTLRVGEEYTVRMIVQSNIATDGVLSLYADSVLVDQQAVQLQAAPSLISTTLRTAAPGLLRLRAELQVANDTYSRNNTAAATALVGPPPRILVIEGQPGVAAELRAALRGEGVESEAVSPAVLPPGLSRIDPFDGIVLYDVPAGALTLDQMITIREFVRSEGRGLVAIGGRNSYGLGGYKGTPLEEALPVVMDPPPKKTRPDVALLLIIDHSASMNEPGVNNTGASRSAATKFEMAKEAAIQATETLEGEDRLGVLVFDTTQEWTVPFQQLGDGLSLGQIQDRISGIGLGGGTDILGALQQGLPALEEQTSKVRHVILLTDGRSFDTNRSPYRDLVGRARDQQITISSIAIGIDSDQQLLKDIADWGAGRYYFAGDAEDIPRLTLLESQVARANPLVEQPLRAELAERHPLVRDFAPNALPPLGGYVATTVKPAAETVLRSPDDDPLLAVWQYGLGRAIAWTPQAAGEWAAAWPRWPSYGRFWAQLVRYSLPQPDSGPLQVQVVEQGGVPTLQVDATEPSGKPLDLAQTQATITLPDGKTANVALRQVAPGRYQQELALPQEGPYGIAVQQTAGGQTREALAGYVRPVPAEYLPTGDGPATLARIAEAGGGTLLDGGLAAVPPTEQSDQRPLWPWLLLLALLLWPLEIATTRGWLTRP